MRPLSLTLAQNLGTTTGSTLDVTGSAVTLGSLRWAAEQDLTKLSHGDLSLTVADHDGTTWAWLQANLPSTAGQLPPWLLLDLSGQRRFVGLVDPARIQRDEKAATIQLSAMDWSSQLADLELGGEAWQRPAPLAASGMVPGETRTMDTMVTMTGLSPELQGTGPNNWLQVGDVCTCTVLPGKTFKVLTCREYQGYHFVLLEGWKEAFLAVYQGDPDYPRQVSITRGPREEEPTTYYQVRVDVPKPEGDVKNYTLPLVTVDGIVPGDRLQLLTGATDATFTVLQVDAEAQSVTTKEALDEFKAGDRLYFTEECQEELVHEDARRVLELACQPFLANLSRLEPAVLTSPVFAWLPLRSRDGADIMAPTDLDALADGLRVYSGTARAWDGTPESGWTKASATATRYAPWTDQLVLPPASLLPDESASLIPQGRPRNRWWDWKFYRDGSLSEAETPTAVVVHDYPGQRRVKITATTLEAWAWTGSAWATPTSSAWASTAPLDACILPGVLGVLVVLTAEGMVVVQGTTPATPVAIPTAAQYGRLRTTPWGAYLVSAQGYGRINWTGTSVSLDWVGLTTTGSILPQTLVGLNQQELVTLAVFTATDRAGATTTETWCLRLHATPTAAPIAVERVLEGAPILAGARRDPSALGRVVGHCGGRLWQVSTRLPWTLERFRPSGMTAAELIEHVCQLHLAVAVPSPDGVLHLVSRARWEAPAALLVDQVAVTRSYRWEHFYSRVLVSAEKADTWGQATGPVAGGKTLEISSHPLIWSDSGATAMAAALVTWFGTPREMQVHEWFHEDVETAAPWEVLGPLAQVTLPGDDRTWLLYGLDDDPVKGKAKATLLELPGAGYGQAYGFRRD